MPLLQILEKILKVQKDFREKFPENSNMLSVFAHLLHKVKQSISHLFTV